MRAHDWFVEHRNEFAARLLEPDDERLFHDHLGRCAECREVVAAAARDLAWLPMGIKPVTPRPDFTRQVVTEITSQRPRSQWMKMLVLAAAVLILAVSATWIATQGRISTLERNLAAARDTLSVLRAERILQASIEMDGKKGGMLIFDDETSHRWKVVVHGLPAPPPGESYTFWFITADGMVWGAKVVCDERNPAVLTLDMPQGALGIRGGALTIEPTPARSSAPQGKELAHLEM